MKRLFILVITYSSIWNILLLDVGHAAAIETTIVQTSNRDAKIDDNPVLHTNIKKRSSTAFKRLPGWSVYYGKRSYDSSPIDEADSVRGKSELDMNLLNEISDMDDLGKNDMHFDDIDTHQRETDKGFVNSDIKRANLQTWMTTYGKRSLPLEKDVEDHEQNVSEDDSSDKNGFQHENDNIHFIEGLWQKYNSNDGLSSHDADKRAPPQWAATYGKRESTDESNEKRGQQWGITYGKRLAGWGATYGKRAPGWSVTYGKSNQGWGGTYGKRVPWGATYGKRAPAWVATYGKRAAGWGATYGKRVPGWRAMYGKRVPGWSATYGKQSNAWNAFYGKRAPGWYATYGKRYVEPEANETVNLTDSNEDSRMENMQTLKRAQGWNAFYGR